MSAPGEQRTAEEAALAARLVSAGRLLGVALEIADDEEWEVLRGGGVRVGLGFYRSRGHGPAEATALSLRELWAVVRQARTAPARLLRLRAVEAARPELGPLLRAVDRIQAGADLLVAMPALRGPLAAATLRAVPRDLGEWPPHLQWIGLLLRGSAGAATPDLADDVRAEHEALRSVGDGSAVARVLGPDGSRSALDRLDRALAILVPPYLRLLERFAAQRGLDVRGGDNSLRHDEQNAGAGLGDTAPASTDTDPEAGGRPGEDAVAGEAGSVEEDPATDTASAPAADPRSLVAAQNSGFVDRVLATPMPADGALVDALLEAGLDPELEASEAEPGESGEPARPAAPGGGQVGADLAEYRSRLARHGDEVRRMREVWRRVIADRLDYRAMPARPAVPEGDALDREGLAGVVAQVRAGVARPAAFLQRRERLRPDREVGGTDYVLVLDRSASMRGRAAETAADAAMVMLEALSAIARDVVRVEAQHGTDLGIGLRTALIVFDTEPLVVKPLARRLDEETRAGLHAAVRGAGGSTNGGAALRAAAEELGIEGRVGAARRRRIVIFVSDGGSADAPLLASEAARLRRAGVEVFGIGIGAAEGMGVFEPAARRLDGVHRLPAALAELVADTAGDSR